jgi:RNase H-like domain found in reverse transcriptase/Reverse transcriptase (RNA-dependent DNA polymerase)/Integrase zinc binding domain/PHD-finger/Integrase core domain/C-5 cytosine-specific DNA methylase
MAVPATTVGTASGPDVLLHQAGAVDFSDAAVQAAAKAELEEVRSKPFDASQLAAQFSHGIDSVLPHGSKAAPSSAEYWTDPETQLLHHRLPELTEEQFMQLVGVTRKYASSTVAYNLDQITGYSGEAPPMSIDLGDVKRVFSPPRRNYSPAELDIIEQKVEELIKAGVVKHVESSNFACNVVLAAKRAPDGTWSDKRFCVNFIPVNKHTVLDNYGSHKAETLLQAVSSKPYLTALDLRSGFHQIHMHPDDISKTCFWYVRKNLPPVLMAYTRMPFGLKCASAKFQRVLDFELQRHGCTEFAYAYIDDLIIASDTWEEHVQHVEKVLLMLQSCGMKIHPSKSIFGSDVLEYLGHNVVGRHGITMNQAKVAALKALPTPTNLLELRSILGFMSYYRHFIPGFSSIAEPMVQLLRKDVPFIWGPEQQQSYSTLRELMTQPGLVLRPIDPKRPLILHTDWSTRGIGAVLGQCDDEGREYLCGCTSRSLNKHERNYPAYKGELLALTWGVHSFRSNLHGVSFKLYTDHRPLTWLMGARDLNGQYARWQMMLQEYDFEVVHRPGVKHQNADVLSRFPAEHTHDSTGAQLDPELPAQTGSAGSSPSSPATCLAAMARRCCVLTPSKADPIDGFCPSFHDLLGTGAAHPDPVYYASHVMAQGQGGHEHAEAAEPAGKLKGSCPEASEELGDPNSEHQQVRAAAKHRVLTAMVKHKSRIMDAVRAVLRSPDSSLPAQTHGLLNRQVVADSFYKHHKQSGITLIELCGGMCSGLEAMLLTGAVVNKYLYCDIDPLARRVAEFRISNLLARFPGRLSMEAIAPAFDLPQDVTAIQLSHIVSVIGTQPQQILVMAGWPCQDYSAAGLGRLGHRASLLQHVLRIVTALQQHYTGPPVAYFFENVATQHNFNHPHIRHQVTHELHEQLGLPVEFDAANAGSYAARLRNYWTNLAPQAVHQALCSALHIDHGGDLYDVLQPGRHPMPVRASEGGFNSRGMVRRIWPTLMSYHQSRSFRAGRPGCVYDSKTDSLTEPNAVERELAMGFEPSCTAATGLSDLERCEILGQAIDLNALIVLLHSAEALHEANLASQHSVAPHRVMTMHQHAVEQARADPAEQEEAVLEASQAASGDVWHDAVLLHFLQNPGTPMADRRVVRRAKHYVWFNNRLHRIVADRYTGHTTFRQVPEPHQRDALILETHVGLGHLGEKRTIAAMAMTYWWYGMTVDIKRVLSGCKLCARVRASIAEPVRDMQTDPAGEFGLFFRWGLDYAQDLPASALGNKHLLIIIDYYSKWVEAIPTDCLTAENTMRLFHLHVCARFGLPAEVITDNGSCFEGAFHDFCARKLIHHRVISEDMPRSNGLAERAVQTIKAALRKHVAERHNALTWDTDGLSSILTGYRCTPQSATGYSPASILFALDPVIDAQQQYIRRGPIDYQADVPVERLAAELLQRSQVAADIGISVVHNLRTAHERDCRRFKARRSGLYMPKVNHFLPGDYVFVLTQGQKLGGTLGIRARNEVLKVLEVRDSGVLLLQNQAGHTVEKHMEHCVPCMLPNILGDTFAGLVKPQADLPCQVCGDHRHWASMLLCDNCDHGWHIYCLDPPLEEVPEGEWLCPDCTGAGMTLELLHEKRQGMVVDEQSRPALELPSRSRIAKARQYADRWHGKAVMHVRRGQVRYGRVIFQGILYPKWFRIAWQDGDSTEHNAGMFRHLMVLDESAVPDGVPPVPPPVVVMALRCVPPALPRLEAPHDVQRFIQLVMGGASCSDLLALDIMGALNRMYSPARADQLPPIHDIMWEALRRLLDFERLHSCLLPVACSGAPTPLLELGMRCFLNSVRRTGRAHSRFNPMSPEMYEFYAAGEGVDAYYVHVFPELLDLILPLALQFVNAVVIAAVPVAYMEADLPHRTAYFLDCIWSKGRGVFVRVIQPTGHQCPMGWLLLFPDLEQRDRLLQGRVDSHSCELLWDSRNPASLVPLRGLHLLHLDLVRQQGILAITRWLNVLARRGGVSVSQLPPHTPDPPISFLKSLHLGPHS